MTFYEFLTHPGLHHTAEVHIDSGQLSVEFNINKTIPNFNKGAEKIHLNWAHSFEKFPNMLESQYKRSGSKLSMIASQSRLIRRWCPLNKIACWRRILSCS